MIHARDMSPLEAIYTFISDDSEVNIASERLLHWVEEQREALEIVLVPCEEHVAWKFMDEDRSVSGLWLKQMISGLQAFDDLPPIIFACVDGSEHPHMLVDGHHRYVLHAILGQRWIRAIILREEQWKPFEISGLRSMTAQELREAPIVKVLE